MRARVNYRATCGSYRVKKAKDCIELFSVLEYFSVLGKKLLLYLVFVLFCVLERFIEELAVSKGGKKARLS